MVTFIGPSFADLGQPFPLVYTHTYFESVLIEGDNNIEIEPSYQCMDEKWFFDLEKQPVIQKHEGWNIEKHGNATGKIIG
ncbi:MAG: hypothetical protein U9Q15_00660 [Patescibacteria group bacterium]|nr:hypothetical protein [Patescibacteria group bacterium]